jgi:hypothetical protein
LKQNIETGSNKTFEKVVNILNEIKIKITVFLKFKYKKI